MRFEGVIRISVGFKGEKEEISYFFDRRGLFDLRVPRAGIINVHLGAIIEFLAIGYVRAVVLIVTDHVMIFRTLLFGIYFQIPSLSHDRFGIAPLGG